MYKIKKVICIIVLKKSIIDQFARAAEDKTKRLLFVLTKQIAA